MAGGFLLYGTITSERFVSAAEPVETNLDILGQAEIFVNKLITVTGKSGKLTGNVGSERVETGFSANKLIKSLYGYEM